jgi:hypothetical protein
MKLRLLVITATAVALAAGLEYHRRVLRERDGLRAQLAELRQEPAIKSYRLSLDGQTAVLQTLIGDVKQAAAIFPAQTDGKFHLEGSPGSNSGGDSTADGIISAGHDYNAYLRGDQGYFKCSPPPGLEETADALTRVINRVAEHVSV